MVFIIVRFNTNYVIQYSITVLGKLFFTHTYIFIRKYYIIGTELEFVTLIYRYTYGKYLDYRLF